MKTWRTVGLALMAVVMSVNFAACSDDDDPGQPDQPVSGDLKLKSCIWDMDGGTRLYYDDQGRVDGFDVVDEAGFAYASVVIKYDGNRIEASTEGDVYIECVCTLNDKGHIEKTVYTDDYSTTTNTYTYDGQGQLISCYNLESDETSYLTWENGNIVAGETPYQEATYTYTDVSSTRGLVFLDDILIDAFGSNPLLPILANNGYFGKVPQNLLASVTGSYKDSEYSSTWNLSYEYGSNGYVSKISATGGYDFDDSSVTLTWE